MEILRNQNFLDKTKQSHYILRKNHAGFLAVLVLFLLLGQVVRTKGLSLESAKPNSEVLGVTTVVARGEPIVVHQVFPKKIGDANTDTISAKSFLVYDKETNQTLLERNSNEELPIASMTKLLTAFIAYNRLDLQTPLVVQGKDVLNVRPILGLHTGDEVDAVNLIEAMLVGSANDAAQVLASSTANQTGQGFVSLMNQTAQNLGMLESHFSNPVGFDMQGNFSSAHDLGLLIRAAKELPVFDATEHKINFSFSNGQGRKYFVRATNKLINTHPDISAIKTGYTETAGGAMAIEVANNSHPFIIIVLGSSNREADALSLKELVEKNFIWE